MMNNKRYDNLFKILIIGDSGVGKSSLLLRYVENTFSPSFISTIGVDYRVKTLTIKDKNIKLQLWDTAGQERFRTITTAFFRGANAVIIVYDISDSNSFQNVQKWIDSVKETSNNPDIPLFLVGNKSDMGNYRVIDKSVGQEFAKNHGIVFFETSAKIKNDTNINNMFEYIATTLLDNYNANYNVYPITSTNNISKLNDGETIQISDNSKKNKDCSCVI